VITGSGPNLVVTDAQVLEGEYEGQIFVEWTVTNRGDTAIDPGESLTPTAITGQTQYISQPIRIWICISTSKLAMEKFIPIMAKYILKVSASTRAGRQLYSLFGTLWFRRRRRLRWLRVSVRRSAD
jgi:hypothetical protein